MTANDALPISEVYLDHHATTPVAAEVLEAMLPFFRDHYGNAASGHRWGQRALAAVEQARSEVSGLIGASPLEVIFTSGATESINLAMKGLAALQTPGRRKIISAVTEHAAVLDTCASLQRQGFEIQLLKVGSDGHLDLNELEAALDSQTLLVSLMFANNEIGTIHDVAAIGALAHRHGAFFHCDAAQALGREHVDVIAQHIDLLSLSGHKLYGPKGVGALYVRRKDPRVRLEALLHGGGHERGLRSGTLNVPLIVGLGEACRLGRAQAELDAVHTRCLRDRFLQGLAPLAPQLNGDMERRLTANLNLRFQGVPASQLMAAIPEIACSTASACTRQMKGPSQTLRALGLTSEAAAESVRFGFGRTNTMAEIEFAIDRITAAVKHLREVPIKQASCEL